MLPGLLELSVICKEQVSPDHGWWRAKPRPWMVESRLAVCGLKHRHRKWANTKPRVFLRNKSLCVREVRISSPSPPCYPKLCLGRTLGWPLPRAGSPAHHASPISFFLALLQFGVTLKPLLTRSSGCELY